MNTVLMNLFVTYMKKQEILPNLRKMRNYTDIIK